MGFRYLEAFIITLLGIIAICFAVQIGLARPDWGPLIRGFAPTTQIVTNPEMLYLALGILGATVMPHNLYLHSAIVQTRAYGESEPEKREAIKYATIDSTVALMFALLINAAILILAAATFHKTGKTDVTELGQAHSLLSPLLGSLIAPSLFGIALLCCGLNSTVTATLAGQAVMEGFVDIKVQPWLRRLITRAIAIVPAVIVIGIYGEGKSTALLVASQVCLSMQLGFACWPLMRFTGERAKMGEFVNPWWIKLLGWTVTLVIIGLNVKLLLDFSGLLEGK